MMIKIILNFFLIISLISASSVNVSSIFGVRWMLGDSFALPSDSTEQYILMFNSHKVLSGDIYAQTKHTTTTCSSTTFTRPLSTVIYKCIFNILHKSSLIRQLNYSIVQ